MWFPIVMAINGTLILFNIYMTARAYFSYRSLRISTKRSIKEAQQFAQYTALLAPPSVANWTHTTTTTQEPTIEVGWLTRRARRTNRRP